MNIVLFSSEELEDPLPKNDPRANHIMDVLRIQPGESFDVGLIDGPRGKATVIDISDQSLNLEFKWHSKIPTLLPIDLWLSFCRPQTCRKVLQECTSMGVNSITLFDTEKCEPTYRDSRLWKTDEAQRLMIKGAEQAFCTRIPTLNSYASLQEAIEHGNDTGTKLALDNYESNSFLGGIHASEEPITLAVGGERGWSRTERDLLREAGFSLVDLGSRVLRTETACIAAIAILACSLAG